jgi:hypothetical protein
MFIPFYTNHLLKKCGGFTIALPTLYIGDHDTSLWECLQINQYIFRYLLLAWGNGKAREHNMPMQSYAW